MFARTKTDLTEVDLSFIKFLANNDSVNKLIEIPMILIDIPLALFVRPWNVLDPFSPKK